LTAAGARRWGDDAGEPLFRNFGRNDVCAAGERFTTKRRVFEARSANFSLCRLTTC
jgi:hypothetical protein